MVHLSTVVNSRRSVCCLSWIIFWWRRSKRGEQKSPLRVIYPRIDVLLIVFALSARRVSFHGYKQQAFNSKYGTCFSATGCFTSTIVLSVQWLVQQLQAFWDDGMYVVRWPDHRSVLHCSVILRMQPALMRFVCTWSRLLLLSLVVVIAFFQERGNVNRFSSTTGCSRSIQGDDGISLCSLSLSTACGLNFK